MQPPMPPRMTKSMKSAQPAGRGESSPDISLNHRDAEGHQSRTMGATSRSTTSPVTTAPPSDTEAHSDAIAHSRKSDKITVCGTRNHPRRPRRSDKAIPSDSRSGKEPHKTNGQISPSRSTATTAEITSTRISSTASATYIQPSTSTIFTGMGLFIDHSLPASRHERRRRNDGNRGIVVSLRPQSPWNGLPDEGPRARR